MKHHAVSAARPAVDVGCALEALTAKVDRLIALVEERVPAPLPERSWLSVEEAAALAGRSPQTISGWCRSSHIGTRTRGRWRIDRGYLRRLLISRFGEDRLPAGLR